MNGYRIDPEEIGLKIDVQWGVSRHPSGPYTIAQPRSSLSLELRGDALNDLLDLAFGTLHDEGPGSAEHVQPCGHDDSSAVGPEPESPNADTSVEVPHRGGRGGGGGADSCTSPLSHERIAANVTVGAHRPSIDAQLGEFQDLLHRLWRAAIRLSNGEPAPPASSRRGRQAGNPARKHIS